VTAPTADGTGPTGAADEGTALAELGPFFAVATHDADTASEQDAGLAGGRGAGRHAAHDPGVEAGRDTRRGADHDPGRETDRGPAPRTDGVRGSAPGPWRSMAELVDRPDVLTERVATVRALLAAGSGRPPEAVEWRVAVSVAHLGLVARIISPYLAFAVLDGRMPERLRLADLRWRPALGGPYPLSLPRLPGSEDREGREDDAAEDLHPVTGARDTARLAHALSDVLCAGPAGELVAACAALRVSPRVLWGNTASAVAGAAGMIAAARPDAAARARALAALLLDRGPLRGTAVPTPAGGFRRRSCCLIYRAAPGGSGALCGDCALSHVPGGRA